MDRWNNRVAVVTGVSSGIGKTIVKALLKNHMIVVGIARRENLLMVSIIFKINDSKNYLIFILLYFPTLVRN